MQIRFRPYLHDAVPDVPLNIGSGYARFKLTTLLAALSSGADLFCGATGTLINCFNR